MKNSYEKLDDIKRMQEEAIKRVQEMQKRAKQSLEKSQPYILKNSNPVTNGPLKIKENKDLKKDKPLNNKNKDLTPNNIFSLLTKDTEKSLIILLLMLLVDEETDIGLVLALIYLIM